MQRSPLAFDETVVVAMLVFDHRGSLFMLAPMAS